MALYPLTAPRIPYRGSKIARLEKAAALHRLAERIVGYINEQMEQGGDEIRMFSYGLVAHTLKAELKDVETILGELGGGGNGITVVKRGDPAPASFLARLERRSLESRFFDLRGWP
jgi:hypothetical protein